MQNRMYTYKHWQSVSGQLGGYFKQFAMHQLSFRTACVELRATHTCDLNIQWQFNVVKSHTTTFIIYLT